jgi:hypothetical protein
VHRFVVKYTRLTFNAKPQSFRKARRELKEKEERGTEEGEKLTTTQEPQVPQTFATLKHAVHQLFLAPLR